MEKEKTKSIFDNFTNQYSLSKTLRFELKPEGNTLKKMKENLEYDSDLQTFLADQKIEDAYQILKPVFDKIHEEFITKSLKSIKAKKIDFSPYFDLYKKQKEEQDKQKKKNFEKLIQNEEKKIRERFEELYKITGEKFKAVAGKDEKDKDILKEESYKVLTESGILQYIKKESANFEDLKLPKVKALFDGSEKNNKGKIEKALQEVNKFFTYFGGFNQNRENYYETKKAVSTAIATRVVSDNLPKFIDNILSFEKQKDLYLKIFDFLTKLGKDLKLKNPKWGRIDKKDEFIPAQKITADIFNIKYFLQSVKILKNH